ncbi:sulfatase-like hydrolase/transferase [Paenibacillus sp. D2_2]|uniref:sulfatase-like hydrolase/transferase n=1 Tax=Paenibacillus sp. D2_2 TaxID=3073092 RepID=UPI002814B806|nr:sulfatase-like hydrolase/transferase [Paenibacillus sp. D2_2]WMT43006.1 sulfatase-like hydrolase/transferase [Paenibacillus sp. D2_2]
MSDPLTWSERRLNKPNILILLVDEERYPPPYENPEIQEWRRQNLLAQQFLKQHSLEFHRHYIGSSACSPSRATIMTGHYPSLHGVTQTNGVAKSAFDADMFWLDRNTVPTMGDYFREAGYQTFYKGKWHVSDEDIIVPGTLNSLPSYDTKIGVPDPQLAQLYARAERLNDFGFHGWIGPEPHGKNPRNSGSSASNGISGRDVVYAAETVQLIESLDQQKINDENPPPWLIVTSFVNPHDIVLYGAITAHLPMFHFAVEGTIPEVTPSPTNHEPLNTKPRCQASYRDIYPRALQPITNQSFYRRLYYQLQKNADQQMQKVLEALIRSSFYDNTIVIFTSDHGDLLGSHGHLYQKWYCAYEEFLHVPLLIHNRHLFPHGQDTHTLTSHVDLLPTMLGLIGADVPEIQRRLQDRFSEAKPLVGRNLAPPMLNQNANIIADEPLYFMTDDDVTRGLRQINPLGMPYPAVVQPNHIETVIMALENNGVKELWKLSRYFDNVQFWSEPGVRDVILTSQITDNLTEDSPSKCSLHVKTVPEQDEYELYNLTLDPLEAKNLAHPAFATTYGRSIQQTMMQLLDEQRKLKRLYPSQSGIT